MRGIHFQMPMDSEVSTNGCCRHTHVVGVDRMPWPSRSDYQGGILTIRRDGREGCSVRLPRKVDGFGDVVLRTSCLMQRDEPYRLDVELCRGQMTQLRNHLAAWESEGWTPPKSLEDRLRYALRMLQKSVMASEPLEAQKAALECLRESLWLSEELAFERAKGALSKMHSNGQPRPLNIGCVLDEEMVDEHEILALVDTFDHLILPVHWRRIETRQGVYQWDRLERQIQAAKRAQIPFTVGPIVDFHAKELPEWLGRWQNDPKCLLALMIDFVESCVAKFKDRVHDWETTTNSNLVCLPCYSEDQWLWLTRRLVEATQDIDPYANYSLSIGQPWGEYLANARCSYSPVNFVDALLRSDLSVSGVNLDVAMGYADGGSYCRGLLDFSEMLDQFSKLEIPLRVRFAFPSTPLAQQESMNAGAWHGSPTPSVQADFLEKFMTVALSKSRVERITWGTYRDSLEGRWPLSGLVTAAGEPKPALARLQAIRRTYQLGEREGIGSVGANGA
ncbi:MAG: hypothetical protein U1D30_02335 [Planctomycetota bacterium]